MTDSQADKNAPPEQAAIKDHLWRGFARVALHVIFILIGAWLTALFADYSSYKPTLENGEEARGALLFLTYLSLLLIFPSRHDLHATKFGIIAALLGIFTGYWPLAMVFGGTVCFLLTTFHHRKIALGSTFVLLLLTLLLVTDSYFPAIPAWYYLLLGGIFAWGMLRRAPAIQAENLSSQQENLPMPAPASTQQTSADDNDGLNFDVDPYLASLKEIKRLKKHLPNEMVPYLDVIETKTVAILRCMQDDPRDISFGKHFLGRYLPMLQGNIERFIRLLANQPSSAEFEQITQQTSQAIADLSLAFSDMHQRLLVNDLDDLTAELNVMHKLAKAEGYKVGKE